LEEEYMRKLMTLMTAALALGVVVPGAANAQSRDRKVTAGDVVRRKDSRDRDVRVERRDDRTVRDVRDRRDDDRDSDRNGKNGKGPAFCRSGAGHPVHGRQWCRDKGFGLGRDSRNGSWDRVTWNDVIFRRRPRNDYMGRDVLYEVLGGSVFNRLDTQRRYWGVNSPLTGRWDYYEGRSVLLVGAGGIPIAELVDVNNDRRVDYILLNRRG
jgi:hypothetical protein